MDRVMGSAPLLDGLLAGCCVVSRQHQQQPKKKKSQQSDLKRIKQQFCSSICLAGHSDEESQRTLITGIGMDEFIRRLQLKS